MDYDKLLSELVERLGLQEWRIDLHPCCKPDEMTDGYTVGCSVWQEVIKTSRIEIIDPAFYGERIIPFDWEKTLVHELLHIKTCLISSECNPLQERVAHQLIDDIARALVDAKRCQA